jgi:hypothetical protein
MFTRRLVAWVIVTVAVAAFVFVSWPGYTGRGPNTPWDYVGIAATDAMAGSRWALAVLVLGGLVIIAILAAALWLVRWVARGEPG